MVIVSILSVRVNARAGIFCTSLPIIKVFTDEFEMIPPLVLLYSALIALYNTLLSFVQEPNALEPISVTVVGMVSVADS